MKKILDVLAATQPLQEATQLYLFKIIRKDVLKSRSCLLRPGQVNDRIWFVEEGVLQCYEKLNNRYIFNWFMLPGDVAVSVISFFEGEPSTETIQVLKDCVLWSISKQELEEGYRLYPDLQTLGYRLMSKYYCQTRRMESILRKKTPEEIYKYLRETNPAILKLVPKKYLASFMGVSEPTLYAIIKNWS